MIEILRVALALGALWLAARLFAKIFAMLGQPPVIGEIVGGLVLGPTLFAPLLPAASAWFFPKDHDLLQSTLSICDHGGLWFLMFGSGMGVRFGLDRIERHCALVVTGTGTLIPFFATWLLFAFVVQKNGEGLLDLSEHYGPKVHETAFFLVIAIAVSVTSIPVISRIMLDLDIMETAFARIVLGAAIVGDILLYVVLAIALGLVGGDLESYRGIEAALGIAPDSLGSRAYRLVIPLIFIASALAWGPKLVQLRILKKPLKAPLVVPIAIIIGFLFAVTGLGVYLGVASMFGAFVAGMLVGRWPDHWAPARDLIQSLSFATVVPIYFAIVGFRIDLGRGFSVGDFVALLVFACLVKTLSAYVGARWARETRRGAANLAIAMNARGGPGIVLAAVAFGAGIISPGFYSQLVMLAVVTSLLAGWWLTRAVRSGHSLRGE